MYLHLGQDTVVRFADIIGVFDVETASVGKITRHFLANAERQLCVTDISNDLPKSFVVCVDNTDAVRVYLSQISSSTLKKRMGYLDDIANAAP